MLHLSPGATHSPVRGLGRDFRLLATGQGLSMLGATFQPIALTVAIIGSHRSVSTLGVLMAVLVASQMMWTLVGGVIADRLEARRVVIVADLVRAGAAAGMAVTFATGHASTLLLAGLMVVMGTGSAFFGPAMRSIKQIIVQPDQRKSANSVLSALSSSTSIIGPTLAGVIVGFAGAPVGFTINALSFVISTAAVAMLAVRVPRASSDGFRADFIGGFKALRAQDWLLWGVSSAAVVHLAIGVLVVLVDVVAFRDLGGAPALGIIAAAQGAGGLAGSLLAMRLRPGRPLVVGYVALLTMPIWISTYVWSSHLSVIVAFAVIGFLGMVFFGIQWETAIQDHVPHDRIARVASWDILTSFIGMPVGNALAGPLSDAWGMNAVLTVAAIVLAVAGVFPLLSHGTRHLGSTATVGKPAGTVHQTA